MNTNNSVGEFYDKNVITEDTRLSSLSSEYILTNYLLEKYGIKNQKVLDLGGGTGIYAFSLIKQNNNITLADISNKELTFVEKKAKELKVNINTIFQNASEYNNDFHEKFETTLCLGPLYHCKSLEEINAIIDNVYSYTKNKGYIFLGFLSKYSKFNDTVHFDEKFHKEDLTLLKNYFKYINNNNDSFIFERRNELPITFTTPEKLNELFQDKKYHVITITCVDYIPTLAHNCSIPAKEYLIELGKSIKLNSGSHILVVIRKTDEIQ